MKQQSNCLSCNSLIEYDDGNEYGHFCNNRCQQEYRYLHNTKPRIEMGKVSERHTLKRYLIRERGEKCVICNNLPVWNGMPLSLIVDHIDGNSDNHSPINLRLVCPNCNSQLPTTKNRTMKSAKRNVYLRKYKQTHEVRN